MDKNILKGLGLTSNEIEVYLTLLKRPSISVNEVSKRNGMHRQAIYDALERLQEKEFVSFVVKDGKKYFDPIDPEKILDYMQEKEQKFKSMLPELLRMHNSSNEETSIRVFKGKGIMRIVYRDVREEFAEKPGEVLISGADEGKFMDEDRVALEQHLKMLHKMKCTERLLIREDDHMMLTSPLTKYRWMKREFFTNAPIYVYGGKMALIIFGDPNYAIIVENEELADSYRKQFELLWEMSREPKIHGVQ